MMSPPPVPKDSSAHSVPPIELEPSSSQANQTLPSGPASSPMMVHSPASDIKSGHRCRAAGEPRSAGGAKMSASAVEARTSIRGGDDRSAAKFDEAERLEGDDRGS